MAKERLQYITVEQAARLSQKHHKTIRRAITTKKLIAFKAMGSASWRIDMDDFHTWLLGESNNRQYGPALIPTSTQPDLETQIDALNGSLSDASKRKEVRSLNRVTIKTKKLVRRNNGYFYTYVKIKGKGPIRVSTGTGVRQEAEAFLNRLVMRLQESLSPGSETPTPDSEALLTRPQIPNNVGDLGEVTVSEFKEKYFEYASRHAVSTVELRKQHWNTFFFGRPEDSIAGNQRSVKRTRFRREYLHEYTSLDADLYFSQRLKEVEPPTYNSELRTMKAIFRLAVKWGYLKRSPLEGVEWVDEPEKEFQALNQRERIQLLKLCEAKYPDYYAGMALVMYTGMRLGEAENVRWEQIDFKNKVLRVVNTTNFKIKTKRNRYPQIPPPLFQILQSRKRNKGYILPSTSEKDGKRKTGLTWRIKQLGKVLGLKLNTKYLRHNYSTTSINNGVSKKQIRVNTGHRTDDAFDHYNHPEERSDQIDKVWGDELD